MRPSVTIAIPTRNRASYLRASLDSALAAAGPEDRIIVSDNASTDDTPALLAALDDPRVTLLRQPADVGMVGNWNICLAKATGEYFLLLSDDDLIEPGALDALADALADTQVAFAYGRAKVIDETGAQRTVGHVGPPREPGLALVEAWFKSQRTLYPCAMLLRRDELNAVGGYNAAFGPFADVGAWLGLCLSNPERSIAFVRHVVASYRVHERALSTGDMRSGLDGIAQLAAQFQAACGPHARDGFARLRSHYIASTLRRRARATRFPLLAYGALCLQHLGLIAGSAALEPYWRQVRILAMPNAYERDKRVLADRIERPS